MREFGDLRSLLERPSISVFDVILGVLGEVASEQPERLKEEWLPYMERALERWPDAMRVVRGKRLAAFETGKPMSSGLSGASL